MSKPSVAVIFGSRSSEHDVSIITALVSIIAPLQLTGKYNVVPVYITKDGIWYSDPKLSDVQLYSSGKIDSYLNKLKPVAISFGKGMTLVQPGLRAEDRCKRATNDRDPRRLPRHRSALRTPTGAASRARVRAAPTRRRRVSERSAGG